MATKSQEPKKEGQETPSKLNSDKGPITTDKPLSEKDEIKEAEERTNKKTKKDA